MNCRILVEMRPETTEKLVVLGADSAEETVVSTVDSVGDLDEWCIRNEIGKLLSVPRCMH